MLFRPFFFREKDAGGGGTPPPAADPATPPATSPTSGGSGSPVSTGEPDKDGKAAATSGGTGGEEIHFTPTALKERLDRAEKSAQMTLAKSLGFETVEAMQKAVEEGQKAVREKMSEKERAEADLATARKEAAEAREGETKAKHEATQARLEAEALSLMAGKFANPKAALKLVDLTGVTLTDPKFPGLPEAIEKLAKDEPWTLMQTNSSAKKPLAPNIGATNPTNDGKPQTTDAERHQKYFGGGVRNSGFFQGGGVRVSSGKGQRIGGGG